MKQAHYGLNKDLFHNQGSLNQDSECGVMFIIKSACQYLKQCIFLQRTANYERYSAWPQGYKTVFMLNSTENEIHPSQKCCNANKMPLALLIFISMIKTTSESLKARNISILAF